MIPLNDWVNAIAEILSKRENLEIQIKVKGGDEYKVI